MFLVAIPIVVPYWKSHGLSMEEIFWLQAIFSIIVVALEIPSGYISDLLSRKKTLISRLTIIWNRLHHSHERRSFSGVCLL